MGINAKFEAGLILTKVLSRMHSKMAYVAAVHENQKDVIMLAWSAGAMASCDMAEKPIDYHVTKMGLWGDALRQKKIFISNDYANEKSPSKHGYPQGHVEVKRHMNGPIIHSGKVIAIIGAGNSASEYTAEDEKMLSALFNEIKDKMLSIRDAAFEK